MRVGNGYDIHRLVVGRPLILGGVTIPSAKGLAGHSDGDSLTHAIIDALLGAAALGDIGMHFAPGDPRYKGADSLDLLRHVVGLLLENGRTIVNVDSVIISEAPKLSPHFFEMRSRLATALGVDIAAVSVKATTNEGLDAIGRGEAIAAQAVALIQ